jgi:WD repeat-containing protein 40A
MVIDLKTGNYVEIGCLKTSGSYAPEMSPCGIHAVETNPSGTLLATGAEKPNELAIYKVPTFDPVCVGEGCHTDWIFDIKWLDDEYLITGSRDSKLAIWNVTPDSPDSGSSESGHFYMKCLESISCERDQRIRAIVFNETQSDIVALTLNAKVHVFDASTLRRKETKPLPTSSENVCLAHSKDKNIYAIGSKSSIHLLDVDGFCNQTIESKHHQCGVRSISFAGDLLTIGTGAGGVLFYDIRRMNYLDDVRRDRYSELLCSEGYVRQDEEYYEAYLSNMDYKPAIYTHKYDDTATRLFVAGGPLPANISGNYAALWS